MIEELRKELQEQDNLATADPYWVIRDWEKVPTDLDYSDKYFWYLDEGEYTDEEVKECLRDNKIEFNEDNWEQIAKEDGWTKVYYLEKHIDKGVFLTHKAAKKHLECCKHHYTDKAYTYAQSLYNCEEVKALRQAILSGQLAEIPTNTAGDKNE